MRLFVKVKPGVKKAYIKEEEPGQYIVAVTARAQENRANEAVVAALAKHFRVSRSLVRIISGAKGKEKRIAIGE